MRSVAGGEYCLLIAPENGTDGLLVRSEGSSCARYSAYIPGGRLMTLVTPELERALRRCETAAKEAVRRECVQTLTGKWTCSLAELDAAFMRRSPEDTRTPGSISVCSMRRCRKVCAGCWTKWPPKKN